jgi:GTPase involved in cell partitioning and DNA repair
MKQMKMLLDEMHQYVQAFNRNNQILKDNWQDRKSEHFSDTCITIVNGTCQEYMQTVEQVQMGINSSLEQLKAMEQELNKELSAPTWSYKG